MHNVLSCHIHIFHSLVSFSFALFLFIYIGIAYKHIASSNNLHNPKNKKKTKKKSKKKIKNQNKSSSSLDKFSDPTLPLSLMFYLSPLQTSYLSLSKAIYAGFFCFGSEYNFPGKILKNRGLCNLELAGKSRLKVILPIILITLKILH